MGEIENSRENFIQTIAPGEVCEYYDIVILGKIKRSLLERFYVSDA
nr:hypothetical protein [Nostoc sp. EkiNYC01]